MKVESVARGLEVLKLINLGRGVCLADVAGAAGLSRGTTYRILHTLKANGLIDRTESGEYHVTRRVSTLSHGYDDDWIGEVVGPIITRAGKEVTWPLSFSEHVCGSVLVRLTTDKDSPLVFNIVRPGYNMSMLDTASGRVLLAYSSPEKQEIILEYIVGLGGNRALAAEMLGRSFEAAGELIRSRGYDQHHIHGARQTALAVPVRNAQNEVVAALGVRYFTSAMSIDAAVSKFLVPLQKAADEIQSSLVARGGAAQ